MAGPTARARFWLTAPSEIACGRSAGPTSSGCRVCQVGEVSACPVPTANSSASSTHGVTSPAIASAPERGRRDQHEGLGDQQEPAPVDQVADGPGQHREQHHGQARRGLHQRDVGRRAGQGQHQPLRGDRLHPAADVADRTGRPTWPRTAGAGTGTRPTAAARRGAGIGGPAWLACGAFIGLTVADPGFACHHPDGAVSSPRYLPRRCAHLRHAPRPELGTSARPELAGALRGRLFVTSHLAQLATSRPAGS